MTESPKTVEADLARLALLGVLLLPMGDPNLELDMDFCRAVPILLTLLSDNMLEREDIFDKCFFFFVSCLCVILLSQHGFKEPINPINHKPIKHYVIKTNLKMLLRPKQITQHYFRKLKVLEDSTIYLPDIRPKKPAK